MREQTKATGKSRKQAVQVSRRKTKQVAASAKKPRKRSWKKVVEEKGSVIDYIAVRVIITGMLLYDLVELVHAKF